MPYCSNCGQRSEAQVLPCPFCGGLMQPTLPLPPSGEYTPQDQAAFTPAPAEAGADERFLTGYSWGTGCGLYLYSNAMKIFLLLSIPLDIVSGLYGEPLKTPAHSAAQASLVQITISLLCSMAVLGLRIWAGKEARRRRWAWCKWRDFEHFRRDERIWSIPGIMGWVLAAMMLVLGWFNFIVILARTV